MRAVTIDRDDAATDAQVRVMHAFRMWGCPNHMSPRNYGRFPDSVDPLLRDPQEEMSFERRGSLNTTFDYSYGGTPFSMLFGIFLMPFRTHYFFSSEVRRAVTRYILRRYRRALSRAGHLLSVSLSLSLSVSLSLCVFVCVCGYTYMHSLTH